MITPVKSSVQRDFRVELGTQACPAAFDDSTPLTPVALIAGNIGLPKPRSNQILKHQRYVITGAQTTQVATASSTLKVSLIGALFITNSTASAGSMQIYDDTSGSESDASQIIQYNNPAGATNYSLFFPLPIECNKGIRLRADTPAPGASIILPIWLEEDIGER